MAALHSALQALGPTSYDDVPESESEFKAYLSNIFQQSYLIAESVPQPLFDDKIQATRPRADTNASVASNASEISASPARSAHPGPEYEDLQKEWGKPMRFSAKDNPMSMSVWKMNGKDGKGAWFARRSVHEGLGFSRWKRAFEREFPEGMENGGPGKGNIRGIGSERRVEHIDVNGIGKLEVYHLSTQFPGPTAARDFVTLLLTTSNPTQDSSCESVSSKYAFPKLTQSSPRQYMIVSKPCNHPDCPPRDGFIRGQYESVEFIREIPRSPPRRSSSVNDLEGLQDTKRSRADTADMNREAILRNARKNVSSIEEKHSVNGAAASEGNAQVKRPRGKTINLPSSGASTKSDGDEYTPVFDESELNPVEWIMITRSDPGGSVPRWMVERGTPSSIIADARKFLDWAASKEYANKEGDIDEEEGHLPEYETNGHLAGVDSIDHEEVAEENKSETQQEQQQSGGIISSISDTLNTYAPQTVLDYLPKQHQREESGSTFVSSQPDEDRDEDRDDTASMTSTVDSFASADSHFDASSVRDDASKSTSSESKSKEEKERQKNLTPAERQLQKYHHRIAMLDAKLARAKERELKDKETLTSKEEERIRKAEEKHKAQMQKENEKHEREMKKLSERKQREERRADEKVKKEQEKAERTRLIRERDDAKKEAAQLKKERQTMMTQIGELQSENTALAATLGRLVQRGSPDSSTADMLELKKQPVESGRARSSSLFSHGSGGGKKSAASSVSGSPAGSRKGVEVTSGDGKSPEKSLNVPGGFEQSTADNVASDKV
ncbi:MAG: hypothetical protein M1834_008385 [Cirrosporium novae-zelandiae]|nr:MAG: hypothetical protein M1834_008385 [Cirrosporium novae-zelandiae]